MLAPLITEPLVTVALHRAAAVQKLCAVGDNTLEHQREHIQQEAVRRGSTLYS